MYKFNFTLLAFFALSFISSNVLFGQDIVFTQYNQSPLSLNPALTGVFNGKIRATTTYRSQWSPILRGDTYTAGALSADGRIDKDSYSIGIGVIGQMDKSGVELGSTFGRLSFSFIKKISESEEASHYLSIGQDIGIVDRNFDSAYDKWFPVYESLEGLGPLFDPVYDGTIFKISHLDMATGISWFSTLKGHNRFIVGLAFHHINKIDGTGKNEFGDVTFGNSNMRLTLHGGGEVALARVFSLTPSFVFHNQGESQALQIGSGLRKYISEESSNYIEFVVQMRMSGDVGVNRDALVTMLSGVIGDLSIGISYGAPTSKLQQAYSMKGALEVSLGYVFGGSIESDLPIY